MAEHTLILSECHVDLVQRRVLVDGAETSSLSTKEAQLLQYLSQRPHQVIERDQLLREVWGYADGVVSRAVDSTIRRLRSKVPGSGNHVVTVFGEGYKYVPHEVAPELVGGTGLIGRDALLATVEQAVRGKGFVTLIGPGGIGKTALARTVCERAARGLFCDLVSATSETDVWAALAAGLGVKGTGRLEEVAARVVAAVDAAEGLVLILDNAEQLPAPIGSVAARCSSAGVVVTSRARLRRPEETVIEVGPLAPADGQALFLKRAKRVAGHVDDTEAVAALVEHLDGLPLALELAAARTRVLGPRQILERLDAGRLRLLEDADRGLSAALDLSWKLLPSRAQRALRRLSVFQGPLELDHAARVWAVGEGDALELVTALVDQSLLETTPIGPGRLAYTLLESIRAYAAKRLEEAKEIEVARTRHAELQLEIARGPFEVTRQGPDLRAALGWLRQTDVARAVELGLALRPLWKASADDERLADVLDWLVAHAEARRAEACLLRGEHRMTQGDVNGAADDADEALSAATTEELKGQAWRLSAYVLLRTGDYANAERTLKRARSLLGDDPQVLERLGRIQRITGRVDKAERTYRKAIEGYRARGDDGGAAVAMGGLGNVLLVSDRRHEAVARYTEARALAERAGVPWVGAVYQCNIGMTYGALGDRERSEAELREALATLRAAGDRYNEALALREAAFEAAQVGGASAEHVAEVQRAVDIEVSLKHRFGAMTARVRLAQLLLDQGAHDAARNALTRALDDGGDSPRNIALCGGYLSITRYLLGEIDAEEAAYACVEHAESLAKQGAGELCFPFRVFAATMRREELADLRGYPHYPAANELLEGGGASTDARLIRTLRRASAPRRRR